MEFVRSTTTLPRASPTASAAARAGTATSTTSPNATASRSSPARAPIPSANAAAFCRDRPPTGTSCPRTALGESLLGPIDAMGRWGLDHGHEVALPDD
ncbi:hypothetical protein GCM10010492_33560 [Saccharothrix mutabilis subsp. mutabilis]|uniref:Uncharacterized protein n=1 Tax=Saccharothrix mutabilis subsp. mutabilis TaxID=66855 RepID=A0ABN0TWX4_9PSEU